jgi:hypothetical protein
MNQDVITAFKRLSTQVKDKAVFFSPDIPQKKLKNAIAAYANSVSEKDVLVLIDNTAFGGAKDGVLITEDAIYAHNMAEKPRSIRLNEIKRIDFTEGITGKWQINSTPFAEFNFPGADGLRAVTQAIRDICAAVPAAVGTDPPQPAESVTPSAAEGTRAADTAARGPWPLKVLSKNEAKRVLGDWQTRFPLRKSLFVPSGKTSLKSLTLMFCGGVISVPVSAAVYFLAAVIEMWLVQFLAGVTDWVTNGYGGASPVYLVWMAIFPIIGIVIVVLAALVSWGGITAYVSSGFVQLFGRLGKNRNIAAGILISMVSVCLTFSLPFLLVSLIASLGFDDLIGAFGLPDWDYTIYSILYTINFAGAVVFSGLLIAGYIKEAKFCETCMQFMQRKELPGISDEGFGQMMEALNSDSLPRALKIINQMPGQACTPVLFTCPACNQGYLEPTFMFNAMWMQKDKKGNTREERLARSWTTGSYKLSAADID